MSAEDAHSPVAAPGGRLARRRDFDAIAEWIRPHAHVLDLGCGDGSLLRFLRDKRGATGYGIEIDDPRLMASVANGVNVIQSDLETGLSEFESDSFDYVILSQTLQAVRHTETILREMLRVGREGIVSFPNFGYWRHRAQVLAGNMPVSKNLPYQWYNTPNVHLFTIDDFESFCRAHGIRVLQRAVMNDDGRPVKGWSNLLGALAVYRLDLNRP